ncbi:unnamed protein product [Alopecurus aequalis]
MASLADISKLLDEKLAAARKEIVDDLQSTVLHKIETDIADLKEQATANQAAIANLKEQADANRVTIARLEKNSSSQIFSKEDPTQAKQSPHPHRSSPSGLEGTGEWKPKFHKLEFPIFDGSEDALPWLTRVEQFFDGQGTLESGKDEFSSLLNRRFGPKIRNTELAAIKNLRQIGSVDDYEENFLTLVCRCEGLTEAHQVELFVAGLHKSIRTDVKLMYPKTLEDAMDHARAYEERETPEDSDSILVSKANTGGGVRPSTPELVAPPKAIAALPNRRPLLRLSPTEMDERRAKGLCYNCDDKYAPGHRCKRLYACWVDAPEEEAPDPLDTSTGS